MLVSVGLGWNAEFLGRMWVIDFEIFFHKPRHCQSSTSRAQKLSCFLTFLRMSVHPEEGDPSRIPKKETEGGTLQLAWLL